MTLDSCPFSWRPWPWTALPPQRFPVSIETTSTNCSSDWRQTRDDEHHRQRWFLLILGLDEGAEQRAEGVLVLSRLVVQGVPAGRGCAPSARAYRSLRSLT